MGITTWAEAKRALSERRFKDGFKEGTDDLLSHPIADGGNAQGSPFSSALGDVDSAQGCGVVMATMLEVIHQGGEVLFEISLEHLDRHPVHTGRTAVALNLVESVKHPRYQYVP